MDAIPNVPTASEMLNRTFGYASFGGAQEQIITHVAGGGDALVLIRYALEQIRPSYVVLTEAAYAALLESSQDAANAGLQASLDDLDASRTSHYENADALMKALDADAS